jgi:hypothetical protein
MTHLLFKYYVSVTFPDEATSVPHEPHIETYTICHVIIVYTMPKRDARSDRQWDRIPDRVETDRGSGDQRRRCDGHKRNPENELEAHPSNGGSNLQFHEMTPAIGISSRKEK